MSDAKKRRDGTKIYDFYCIKCGEEYELELTRYSYEKNNYRKHCSRVCSNSHVQSHEQNMKRREKLKGRMVGINRYRKIKPVLRRICDFCKNEFFTNNEKRKYCRKVCASRGNIRKALSMDIDRSAITKRAYENGKKVYGGLTLWYPYKDIKVQGTYELLTCYILDLWKEIGKIQDWDYTNDRFLYTGIDGEKHTYLLDFKVYNNGNFYYLEIKGYEKKNDRMKWDAVRDKGHHLEIWGWNEIKKNGMGMVVPNWEW